MEQFWISIAVSVLTIGAGLLTWSLNERSKRIDQEYRRKESRYVNLLTALRGFYKDSYSKDLRNEFLHQVNLMWLYCPDEVIKSAYSFLEKVQTGKKYSDEEKESAVSVLILAIRKDLLKKNQLKNTKLKSDEFKHLKAT